MNKELRVLIVEDSPADVALIQHALRKANLQVRARRVESRDAFLHEMEHHPPDIILSDHGVPGFDGFAALAEARTRYPEIPFIFVTGSPPESSTEEAFERVADDHVLKSHIERLAPTIERALHVRAKREALAEKAIDRLAELEAASREMEEFTHAIAQDLQTPLRHIESFTGLLMKSASDRLDQKSQGYLKTISCSAHKMGKLIDDLFAFSRIGRAEMYRLPIGLGDIVDEVIHDLRRETESRSVEWVIGDLPQVVGDPVMLWQVMTNLLSNALKFTRPREHARIEINGSTTDTEHIISVRDNGVGFDNHYADKIFGIFKRLRHEEFEGTGVGLANVRRIIHRHGGRVWAEGVEGVGATFYFSLPRTESL